MPPVFMAGGIWCCHFTAVKKRRGIFNMTEPFWRAGKFVATVLRRSARNSSFSPLPSRSRYGRRPLPLYHSMTPSGDWTV